MVYFCKSLVCPIEKHPFHEHKLYFSNLDNGWICDAPEKTGGCKRNIKFEYQSYSVPRFRCHECDFDLCDVCSKFKSHSYSNHPWHKHELYRCYVDNGWICDGRLTKGGCKSYIIDFNQTGNMLRYRCDDCDFDLCYRCMKFGLPDFVDLDDLIYDKKEEIKVDENENKENFDMMDEILSLNDKEITSCEVNFENIDSNELMKFFDKSVPLEPLKNSNLTVEEEEETIKKEDEKEVKIIIPHPNLVDLDDATCIICCERPKNVALVHDLTSHIVCCEFCASKLTDCPLCRKPIELVIKHVFIKESLSLSKEKVK